MVLGLHPQASHWPAGTSAEAVERRVTRLLRAEVPSRERVLPSSKAGGIFSCEALQGQPLSRTFDSGRHFFFLV